MDSKKMIRTSLAQVILLSGLLTSLVACTVSPGDDNSSDYNIGNPLGSMSSLTTPDGSETKTIVLFDKLLRRIHHFDLDTMTAVRSFGVRNPEEEHFVLHAKNGNYIIDLSMKGLSIFNKYNQANHRPIVFQGKPRGAAFNPDAGILVVYDDLSSVGMLQLDPNGEVIGKTVRGATVIPGSAAVISAGDVDANGKLILSMSDNSIIVADTKATMANNKWTGAVQVATTLTDIKWLAPLPLTAPGADRLILAKSEGKVSVVNTVTGAVVSSHTIDGNVEKMSKLVDPHVVLRKGNNVTLVFARNGVIETKSFVMGAGRNEMLSILTSNLNLAKDTWSFVDTPVRLRSVLNDMDEAYENRWFRRYVLSDTLSTHNIAIDNDPQIEISESFIFGLFKDELGYAERININTEEKRTLERFNLRYIPAN